MNKLVNSGRILYCIAMLGLGALCIISKDFIVGRPPQWPQSFFFNPALGYISGVIVIVLSLTIVTHKKGYVAALTMAVLILVLSISRYVPNIMIDWLNASKSFALLGGTLIIAASFKKSKSSLLIWTGSILLAVFFIACGYAHIKFAGFVKDFIPAYIPFHGFFTYFTAACLIAGGIGILIPAVRRWAALLSGVMVGGWFLLLHIPRFITNTQDPSDRMGLFESLGFAGIFFVLAAITTHSKNQKH